jgi:two-component system response regulator VanR
MAEQIEILVVDDDKEIANLVEIYLSSTGYKIHKAYNAVDGLALLQKYDIKLAIIDVMMPQIDGIEMCRRIRTCRNIPIIILSAKSADVDKILGLSVGADGITGQSEVSAETLSGAESGSGAGQQYDRSAGCGH